MEFDRLSNKVIGLAIEVHKELGPGLFENTYKQCLAYECKRERLHFLLEAELPVLYKGTRIECGYRINFNEKLLKRGLKRFVL
jgi:GxxExxY protein